MEDILGYLSLRDITCFGATCSRYHQQSSWVWNRFCSRMPGPLKPKDWKRWAILKRTLRIR